MVCLKCRISSRYSDICDRCMGIRTVEQLSPFTKKTSNDQIWIYCQGIKVYGKPIKVSSLRD
jgi:hypothetical protein